VIGVTENLRKIRDLLHFAAIEANRDPAIREAYAAGQRDFGENFVQEGVEKIEAMAKDDLTWHFIGHLQSNKTRVVAEYFDWVHTIDKFKTARRLSDQRPDDLPPLNLCLQVNVDDEESKSGVTPEALPELAAACRDLPNIRLRGLMCLPAIRENLDEQRIPFAVLRKLAEKLRTGGVDTDTLSMGMTADFRAAILEGATIVRIGTALFGER
jgi:pyridoxal phosphate enzyme (YggS family)